MFRIFLAGALLAFSPLALAQEAGGAPFASAASDRLPTAAFARLPFMEMPELSPDGEHVAGLFGIQGQQAIAMIAVRGGGKPTIIAVPDQTEID
jgi:hypothetical protein